MFSWCLMTMARDESEMQARDCHFWPNSRSVQVRVGNKATATMDPSEIYRKKKTTITKIAAAQRTALGAIMAKAPSPVATPLPPRNFSQMGNMWPRMAQRAASAAQDASCGELEAGTTSQIGRASCRERG